MMKRTTTLAVFVAFFLVGLMFPFPVFSQVLNEPWGVYEDWSSNLIRPSRWIGRVDQGLEVKREIEKNQLAMRYRMTGSRSLDTGYTGGFNRLLARNGAQINQIEADFKIKDYTVAGVSGNPSNTRVRPAAISLAAFNDGTSTGPGDMNGDYFVRVMVNREAGSSDPVGVFRVQAFIFRCIDAQCSNASGDIHDLNVGTVRVGKWFTLRAIWDAPNNSFWVGVNNDPDVVLSYDGIVDDQIPPAQPNADVRMQLVAANSTGTPAETGAEIVVGQVRTNQSAVIP